MRVLVIEDDPTINAELSEGLAQEGFDVRVASDGEAGLLAACDDYFDAVILDLLLPKMSGYKVLQNLRSLGNDVPVLVLTAKTGEYDLAELLSEGADDFVSKPFSYVELVARLHNLVRRRSRGVRSELTSGDLTLDPVQRVVRRRATEIDLTPTEFKILERLLLARPAVVTHQQFLDEIWDPVNPPDPNIVQLYIGYIRRKIDTPFGTDTIRTHRGIGYQIVDPEELL